MSFPFSVSGLHAYGLYPPQRRTCRAQARYKARSFSGRGCRVEASGFQDLGFEGVGFSDFACKVYGLRGLGIEGLGPRV